MKTKLIILITILTTGLITLNSCEKDEPKLKNDTEEQVNPEEPEDLEEPDEPEEPEEPEETKGIIKPGDKINSGTYIAFIKEGELMAINKENYKNVKEEKIIIGSLVSNGTHSFIISNRGFISGKFMSANVPIPDIINVEEENVGEDFEGRKNTEVMKKFIAESEYTSTMIERLTAYEYAGIKNWYLPAGGEMLMIVKHLEAITEIAKMSEDYEVIDLQKALLVSTPHKYRFFFWFNEINRFYSKYKTRTDSYTCPIKEFKL